MKFVVKFFTLMLFSAVISLGACCKDCDNNCDNCDCGVDGVKVVNIAGINPPVIGEAPVKTVTETAQYTGTVSWDGNWTGPQTFAGSKAYTATITLTAKSGYSLEGTAANSFTVSGAVTVTNSAGSGVITAVFPATATVAVGDSVMGGKVAYILQSGDPGYVAGEQRGLIAAVEDLTVLPGRQWAESLFHAAAVTGTGTAIGTGQSNTEKIVSQNGVGIGYAAGLADNYSIGGYTDWYLPSKDELLKLIEYKTQIGGFVEDYYWSSTEESADNATSCNATGSGACLPSGKQYAGMVRPVRSF